MDGVVALSTWCSANNQVLNITNTKEIILDFKKNRGSIPSPFWGTRYQPTCHGKKNTSVVVKRPQQRLHFLRLLRINDISQKLLIIFCRSSIESLFTYCIWVLFRIHPTPHITSLNCCPQAGATCSSEPCQTGLKTSSFRTHPHTTTH